MELSGILSLIQCPLLRSDRHGRWLTSYEALLAQGFPISRELSYGVAVTSFADDIDNIRKSRNPIQPDLDRTARIGMAGNAMHMQVVATMLLCIVSNGAEPLQKFKQTCATSLSSFESSNKKHRCQRQGASDPAVNPNLSISLWNLARAISG